MDLTFTLLHRYFILKLYPLLMSAFFTYQLKKKKRVKSFYYVCILYPTGCSQEKPFLLQMGQSKYHRNHQVQERDFGNAEFLLSQ